jgi:hypothetical protein
MSTKNNGKVEGRSRNGGSSLAGPGDWHLFNQHWRTALWVQGRRKEEERKCNKALLFGDGSLFVGDV